MPIEAALTVHKRKARRKALGTRPPILVEARANARRSLDFVHDQFACGRRFRVLNVVDDVTRECLAAIPANFTTGVIPKPRAAKLAYANRPWEPEVVPAPVSAPEAQAVPVFVYLFPLTAGCVLVLV